MKTQAQKILVPTLSAIAFMTASVSCCLYSATTFAKRTVEMPRGCLQEGFTFHHRALTLLPAKAGSQDSVYFMYNKSNRPINLYQLKGANEHMGLNINNQIKPHQWGVYSSDEDQVRFACSVPSTKYKKGELVDCQERISLCEFTKVKYGLNNRGNYWMASSTSKSGAIRRSIIIGVLLNNK